MKNLVVTIVIIILIIIVFMMIANRVHVGGMPHRENHKHQSSHKNEPIEPIVGSFNPPSSTFVRQSKISNF